MSAPLVTPHRFAADAGRGGAISDSWLASHSPMAMSIRVVSDGCIGWALAYARSLSNCCLLSLKPICWTDFPCCSLAISGQSNAVEIIFATPMAKPLTLRYDTL
jgi:hypothetical protein